MEYEHLLLSKPTREAQRSLPRYVTGSRDGYRRTSKGRRR
jgi:hypothetical protein